MTSRLSQYHSQGVSASMTSTEIVTAEFQLGLKQKDVARKSLDDLPVYLQAAEHFEKAGKLSLKDASNPELNLITRLQAETYGHYYLAEQMSCLAAFHFEQRQAALAAVEHQEAIEHLTRSIAVGESAISKVPAEIAIKLKNNIDFNKFGLQHEELAVMFAKARDSLDRKDLITALDWYTRIIKRSEKAIETAAGFDPVHERISKGNLYGALANAHQAYVHLLIEQFGSMDNQTDLGTMPQDRADQMFLHLYKGYKSGELAFHVNPEWLQYAKLTRVLRSQIKEFLHLNKSAWPVYLDFTASDTELVTIMKGLDIAHFKEIQAEQVERAVNDNTSVRVWAAGSFYATATLAIGLVVYLITTGVTHWWQALLGLATWETLMVIIGCLTLRTVGALSEAGFKDLMKLAVNQQFRLFHSFLQIAKGAISREPKRKGASAATKTIDKSK
jgi:hypothetical protein